MSFQTRGERSHATGGLIDTGRHPLSVRSGTRKWQEYLIEAWALGSFMILLGVVVIALEAPSSPIRQYIPSAGLRRVILAAVMGTSAAALIYSPWGQRSGCLHTAERLELRPNIQYIHEPGGIAHKDDVIAGVKLAINF